MSEYNSPDFIHIPTFSEYILSLEPEQQLALRGFYNSFCNTRYGESVGHLDERSGDYPFAVGRIRSADNTLFALNSTVTAHEDPADYLLTAAQLRDDKIEIDELEIVRVTHDLSGQLGEGLDKIIDAKWHETSRKTSIRLGRHASIVTQEQDGLIIHSSSLPIK